MARALNLLVGFLAILFVASSIKGQEGTTEGFGPFEWPWEKFFDMLETMMDDMTEVILGGIQQMDDIVTSGMDQMNNTILSLADDILLMADKIGDMADRIGDMSLQIGIMADRIVQTEVLLADFILILAGHENSTIPIPPVGNYTFSPPVLVFEPEDGYVVSADLPLELNIEWSEDIAVVLKVSECPVFPEQGTTSILISNPTKIQRAWERVEAHHCNSVNEIYIAVELVDKVTGKTSKLSNSVILQCA